MPSCCSLTTVHEDACLHIWQPLPMKGLMRTCKSRLPQPAAVHGGVRSQSHWFLVMLLTCLAALALLLSPLW